MNRICFQVKGTGSIECEVGIYINTATGLHYEIDIGTTRGSRQNKIITYRYEIGCL